VEASGEAVMLNGRVEVLATGRGVVLFIMVLVLMVVLVVCDQLEGAEESTGNPSDELVVAGAEPKVGVAVRFAVLDICG